VPHNDAIVIENGQAVIKAQPGRRGFPVSGISQEQVSLPMIINPAGMEQKTSSLRKQENPQNLVQGVTQRVGVLRRVSGHVKITRFQASGKDEKPARMSFGVKAGVLKHDFASTVEKSPGLS
jgi:hypothetical protein